MNLFPGQETTMSQIDTLFDKLDQWRHFPNYQLERRADIFFSLYLVEVINTCFKHINISDILIPEFPVRIGTIYPTTNSNQSVKVDYVGISRDGKKAVLVELKTENLSRRESQDQYLIASQAVGLTKLLEGIISIFKTPTSKRKYYHLLCELEKLGQLSLPKAFHKKMQSDTLRGIKSLTDQIEVTSQVEEIEIVYVQPYGEGENVISFRDFYEVVKKKSDPISVRFTQSLLEWAEVKAGGNC